MVLLQNKILWVIIIFICAAIFRLTFLDLIEFKLDEARDVYEMNKFFQNPYLIQRGTIQSTGVYNPPLWYYFLALISLPSRNPQYLSFVIGLLNCVAVAFFYFVVHKFYGQFTGVAAGLLLAFSPWAILMSRKIWAPDLILVLLVPLFYFIFKITHLEGVGKWDWFWVALLLSLIVQLHVSGLFLAAGIVAMLIALHLQGVRAQLGSVLIGLAVSLVPLLPYVAYQFQNNCPDCSAFSNYQNEIKTFDSNVFVRPFQLIGGSSFQIILGDDYQEFSGKFPVINIFNYLFLLEFLLAIIGAVYIFKHKMYFWAVIPILVTSLYFITQTSAVMHYFVILIPIMILFYALGITQFFHPRGVLAITVITFIIIINIIFELSFYNFLSEKQNISGDYGPVFKLSAQQAEEKLTQFKERSDYELIKSEYWVNLFNK